MNTLPQELLDEVLMHIYDEEFPVTERFATITPTSRRTILACRLVERRWYESKMLFCIFVCVLEETPFVWRSHRLPTLEAIGESKYANYMDTLSICGMDVDLVMKGEYERWGAGRDERDEANPITTYLVHLLRQVSWVEHLRFYPISPKCLDGTWPEWEVSKWDKVSRENCVQVGTYEGYGIYQTLVEDGQPWFGVQRESEWIFDRIMEAVWEGDLWLKSVETPLFGNRASYCAVPTFFQWFYSNHLTRVAITITRVWPRQLLDTWFNMLTNLEYLEITLSRSPKGGIYGMWPLSMPYELISTDRDNDPKSFFQHSKLKEFRLMADYRHSFSVPDILRCLTCFPNLKRLGFAYIMFQEGTWSDLLSQLVPMNLERLWLLDPRRVICHGDRTQDSNYQMLRYKEDGHLMDAAHEVRLLDTGCLWTDDGLPPVRWDFEYPGFAIFEQT